MFRKPAANARSSRIFAAWLCGIGLAILASRLTWGAEATTVAATPVDGINIAFLYSDGNVPGTLQAFQSLLSEHPELRQRVKLTLLTESLFNDVSAADMLGANVLVFDTMNEQMLAKFNSTYQTDLIRSVRSHGTVLGVGEGLLGQQSYTQQGVVWDPRARQYFADSGAGNRLGLLKLALTRAGIADLPLPDPQPSLDFGYYYPDGAGGKVFATWEEFDAWRRAHGKQHPGAPRVAISFFKATYYTGDTKSLDALIAEVEHQGGDAVPVFGYPGAETFQHLLIDAQGQPRADVALGGNFSFSSFDTSLQLAKTDIAVLNPIGLYGRSEQDWRSSATGLSDFEGTFNLAVPELAGTIAPTVISTKEKIRDATSGLTAIVTTPVASRTSMLVSRALRYAALRGKPNATKHVALLYYDYPPGKANIGASYLNVADSIANILGELARQGYDLGGAAPSSAQVLADITTRARNVLGHAPGDLQELVAADSDAVRISMTQYRAWLDAYPKSLRDKIIKDWSDPSSSSLMAQRSGAGVELIIPMVRYGNVVLTPQPARAWGEDLEKMYHASNLAPHHQYVAAYAWLRNGFKADAVIHLGTHGTLEWLDGRSAGLAEDDAPDALIADLPNLYVYNVDVVGEGLVARRRSMATLIDHMVPPFTKAGLSPDLTRLGELMNDHSVNETKNPQLADAYAKQIQELAGTLGIAKELGLDPAKQWSDEQLHGIENYLLKVGSQNIPYGLHAFGRTPDPQMRASTVDAIMSVDRSQLPTQSKAQAADMDQRIASSGPLELEGLMKGLSGRFVPAGGGGEPVRNPDSYPTGRNFYGIDPDKVPKPAAWEMGRKLADQMLADHLKQHGHYPEKVSFVIWGDETMRHEGVLESQIFWLLGTRPVWNERGKVVDVEVIPRAQLGRPRVDIVIASAAEGMFSNVTKLMDQAVQKVKALDEADNLVRKHFLATKATLMQRGYSARDAEARAGVRIFDEPPGTYNLNTSTIVAASGSWDSDAGFANDYLRKMGHGYGNGFWGEAMQDVFALALSGTEKVVHSSSTALYGALDNDDMYMYMGGLAAAIRNIDGKTPDTVVANTRDPGHPEMTSLGTFIGQEFRSRYVNPTWIEGMKKEGYAGAGEMRAFAEYLWGWNATTPELVDASLWQESFDVYVQDKYQLQLKQFFEQASPFAYQDITARMLETVRKGYWKPDAATLDQLTREFITSVNAHGSSCSDLTCGNARLLQYALERGQTAGVPTPALRQFRSVMEKALGQSIESAARTLEQFARSNDAREQAEAARTRAAAASASEARQPASAANSPVSENTSANQPVPSPEAASGRKDRSSTTLQGYVMDQQERSSENRSTQQSLSEDDLRPLAWFAALLLGGLMVWRWRYAR
ncbi:MAG: cobaltochelatase subunit CobN [Steroidobacteraceae bacterium]